MWSSFCFAFPDWLGWARIWRITWAYENILRVQIKLDYSFVPDVENGYYMCILIVHFSLNAPEVQYERIRSSACLTEKSSYCRAVHLNIQKVQLCNAWKFISFLFGILHVWHWCSLLLAMVQLSLSLFLTSMLPPLNFYNVATFFLYENNYNISVFFTYNPCCVSLENSLLFVFRGVHFSRRQKLSFFSGRVWFIIS
jgi:hypothetical protein